MRKLYIVGTSGNAKDVALLLKRTDPDGKSWRFAGYISRDSVETGKMLPFGRVVGDDAWLAGLQEPADVVLGVGHPAIRKDIIARLRRNDHLSFPNLIHPAVEIDFEWVHLGKGNVVSKGCEFSCDIQIGDFNQFNKCVGVGHDCIIGSYNVVTTGTHLSGNVQLGDEIFIGSGSEILPRVKVSSRTSIGAGAVVTRDIVEEGGTYVGIPARRR